MTTFTGPVHVRASADAPTGQSIYQSAVPLGTISLVSGGGTSGIVTMATTAQNPVVLGAISSAGGGVICRGLVKILVDGTVACVPFFYSTT